MSALAALVLSLNLKDHMAPDGQHCAPSRQNSARVSVGCRCRSPQRHVADMHDMQRTEGSSSGLPRAELLVRDDDEGDDDSDAGLSLMELKQQAVNALANSASACYEGIICCRLLSLLHA